MAIGRPARLDPAMLSWGSGASPWQAAAEHVVCSESRLTRSGTIFRPFGRATITEASSAVDVRMLLEDPTMRRHAAALAVMIALGTSALHAQDARFTVTTASADVHKAPSTGSPVIGRAARGTALEVTRELGSWVRIPWPDAPDGVGYVHVTRGTISRGGAAEATRTAGIRTAPAPVASESASATTPVRVGQGPARTSMSQPTASLPSHRVGLGGRLGTGAVGYAATARAWSRGPLGVQIEAGRSTFTSAVVPEQVSSMQIAPSVIYTLPNLITNALWARPYAGTGMSIHRSTLRGVAPGIPGSVDTGLGAQAFGGAELTWANLPQLAVSADLRHQWAPAPFSGFDLGGFGVSISAHWYIR
jgi:hypothetical protein